jgi:hypothetical protein
MCRMQADEIQFQMNSSAVASTAVTVGHLTVFIAFSVK